MSGIQSKQRLRLMPIVPQQQMGQGSDAVGVHIRTCVSYRFVLGPAVTQNAARWEALILAYFTSDGRPCFSRKVVTTP